MSNCTYAYVWKGSLSWNLNISSMSVAGGFTAGFAWFYGTPNILSMAADGGFAG